MESIYFLHMFLKFVVFSLLDFCESPLFSPSLPSYLVLCASQAHFFSLPFSSSYMNHSTFRVAGSFSRWIMAWIEQESELLGIFQKPLGGVLYSV